MISSRATNSFPKHSPLCLSTLGPLETWTLQRCTRHTSAMPFECQLACKSAISLAGIEGRHLQGQRSRSRNGNRASETRTTAPKNENSWGVQNGWARWFDNVLKLVAYNGSISYANCQMFYRNEIFKLTIKTNLLLTRGATK